MDFIVPGHHDGRDTENRNHHVDTDEQQWGGYMTIVDSHQ